MQTKEQSALLELLNAYSELCPHPSDKTAIRRSIEEMRADGENDRQICRRVASSIYDGLAYDNWPSTVGVASGK